ncbi:MAG: TIGR04348 family glycosyltransferase [Betaproteobacteria bacterium]|nr:TIGR04348 family glycosyltransferase [Betaproteobacteria bacterium]
MARLVVVTPAAAGARNGNRHTAARWASMLRARGHRVQVVTEWRGEACDAMLALHARRSHASIAAFKNQSRPLVVVLTGTDLYRDLPASRDARDSLALADRVIVLQEEALRSLDATVRRKARVVYQSSDCGLRASPPRKPFRITVVGHLRSEKDPFRTVEALQYIRDENIEVVHIGGALEPKLGAEAEAWMGREPRYRWLGSIPHTRALRHISRSHLLVHSSVMEGGANVLVEAARIGTPVLASRVPGNVGMLGRRYPGYFRLHDDEALAALIRRAMGERQFYAGLQRALRARRPLFSPAAERRGLLRALAGLV